MISEPTPPADPTAFRANRRPTVLLAISLVFLALQHVLLRSMAHGHVAKVLLGAANPSHAARGEASAAVLAVSLLVVRFASYVVVPGLLLAALAELVAYALVGPKRPDEEDEDALRTLDPDD